MQYKSVFHTMFPQYQKRPKNVPSYQGHVIRIGNTVDISQLPASHAQTVVLDEKIDGKNAVRIHGAILVAGTDFRGNQPVKEGNSFAKKSCAYFLKKAGFYAIVAENFTQQFVYEAELVKLCLIELGPNAQNLKDDDIIHFDCNTMIVTNKTAGTTFEAKQPMNRTLTLISFLLVGVLATVLLYYLFFR